MTRVNGADWKRRWYGENVQWLREIYGTENVRHDATEFTWVMLNSFRLPPNWSPRQSALLIETPGVQGAIEMARINFYLNKGLRNKVGNSPGHYFEDQGVLNKYGDRNWAWYCMHLHSWAPAAKVLDGDSLLTAIDSIWQMMARQDR